MEHKKVYVKFYKQFSYREFIYEANKVYEIVDYPQNYAQRWVNRGCEIVDKPENYELDPRFPAKEEELKQEVVEEVVESKEPEEEEPEKVEPKKKTKKGRRKKVDKAEDAVENKEEIL